MNLPFNNKKIGIWGFGIVGQSAFHFIKNDTKNIEILTDQTISINDTSTKVTTQNPQSIINFFENNDFVIISPGIPLHNYLQYQHKFITELDILQTYNIPTIAITGTAGKTTITHLLQSIIKETVPNSIAAGNIGYPIFDMLKNQTDCAVLELSSFQLQHSKSFAPDLAIITNFYENHLDHHFSVEEYLSAKCKILYYQTVKQLALLPIDLLPLTTKHISLKKQWSFFSKIKPSLQEQQDFFEHKIFFLEDEKIKLTEQNKTVTLFDLSTLPKITFDINWVIIIATLHLKNIPLSTIKTAIKEKDIPAHRLQKITTINGSTFYNDSKSTIWQATLQAVNSMDARPIKLFVGGLSKGTNRSQLFQALEDKNIEIYAFGKEAVQIKKMCKKYNINCTQHQTLEESFARCMQDTKSSSNILFSPGGSSFDLFKNYIQRGEFFTKLVKEIRN